MAEQRMLHQVCPGCGGDGVAERNIDGTAPTQLETYTCRLCNGTGFTPLGHSGHGSKHFDSRDVFACMNYFEWVDLDAQPKELLHVVLSMGTLNLSEGSAELATLRVIFPVGKLTRTALEALVA